MRSIDFPTIDMKFMNNGTNLSRCRLILAGIFCHSHSNVHTVFQCIALYFGFTQFYYRSTNAARSFLICGVNVLECTSPCAMQCRVKCPTVCVHCMLHGRCIDMYITVFYAALIEVPNSLCTLYVTR